MTLFRCAVPAFNLLSFPVIDEGEIVYRHFVDISIAVATPKVCSGRIVGAMSRDALISSF